MSHSQSDCTMDDILFKDDHLIQDYISWIKNGDYFLTKALILENIMGSADRSSWLSGGWDQRFSVIQFWDTEKIPDDVEISIQKNRRYFGPEAHKVFNLRSGRDFILKHYNSRVLNAFDFCRHPAMQSDFFRLAYLYICGGLYIDADMEVDTGFNSTMFMKGNNFYVSAAMREHSPKEDDSWHWYSLSDLAAGKADKNLVCYLQNDVIACTPFNEVTRISLVRAILLIEEATAKGSSIRAHTATGPTNLSVASTIHLFMSAIRREAPSSFSVFDRDGCVRGSVYDYKKDDRNWQVAGA